MNKVSFALENIIDEATGQNLQAVVKTTRAEGANDQEEKETWCTILDLDRLFDTCVKQWGSNWNLDKVCSAIQHTDII